MVIKSIKFNCLLRLFLFLFIIFLSLLLIVFTLINNLKLKNHSNLENIFNSDFNGEDFINKISNISTEELANDSQNSPKSYIKWVDFKCPASVLSKLASLDISSHNDQSAKTKYNWIELMAYLGTKYGGDISLFKQSDLDKLINELDSGKTINDLTSNMKLFNYFYQSYDAIFHEFIGEYEILNADSFTYTKKYGLKAFLPIARNYSFSHYKDFGSSRSYGYRRVHLGNDLLR